MFPLWHLTSPLYVCGSNNSIGSMINVTLVIVVIVISDPCYYHCYYFLFKEITKKIKDQYRYMKRKTTFIYKDRKR